MLGVILEPKNNKNNFVRKYLENNNNITMYTRGKTLKYNWCYNGVKKYLGYNSYVTMYILKNNSAFLQNTFW